MPSRNRLQDSSKDFQQSRRGALAAVVAWGCELKENGRQGAKAVAEAPRAGGLVCATWPQIFHVPALQSDQWFLTSRCKKCFAIPPVADDGRKTFGQGLDTREEERSRPRHGNLTWSLWLFCMHGYRLLPLARHQDTRSALWTASEWLRAGVLTPHWIFMGASHPPSGLRCSPRRITRRQQVYWNLATEEKTRLFCFWASGFCEKQSA